jgi:RNA polymerase sigma-70 factor, ECF subfamily
MRSSTRGYERAREPFPPVTRILIGPPHDEQMTATEHEDEKLLRDMLAGDERAFAELYRRRHREVYRFAFGMSRSVALAQDVTQDVFLRVLEGASRYDAAKGSVRAWLLGCARHVVLDRLRAESRWRSEPVDLQEPSAPCTSEESVFVQQRLARLHAAILGLPIEYREALVLCEIAELSYAESAAALGCPIGTVRSRLHRARAQLAARLAEPNSGHEPLRRVNQGHS